MALRTSSFKSLEGESENFMIQIFDLLKEASSIEEDYKVFGG